MLRVWCICGWKSWCEVTEKGMIKLECSPQTGEQIKTPCAQLWGCILITRE